MRVRSLDREEPIEEGMVIHTSILTWDIQWTGAPGRLQSRGRKESDVTEQLSPHARCLCHRLWSVAVT